MSPTTTAVRQPARRGRPCGRGVKRWQGEAVARVVRDALAARDVDDPESVTETTYRLCEALLHESSPARTIPTDRILTGRCDTTLVGRGRSSDSGSRSRGRPHSPAQLDSGREGHHR